MARYKKGRIVKGVVSGIETYGIFVTLDEFYTGLIHISEISYDFVKSIADYVNIGETIFVEILDVDDTTCHLKLSIKNIDYKYHKKKAKRKIKETELGFRTLAYKLPKWIKKSMETINSDNIINK